ncbi:MAG TPA: ribosome silencing factor [Acidimicrobiales bacterium]|nr:ribosome silencing factor [Acidimicrobiales bacterium]
MSSAAAERPAAGTIEQLPPAATTAAHAAAEKLGARTVIMAMGELLAVTDAFVVTSGRNSRQVRTLVDEVERQVKDSTGRAPYSVEGLHDLKWVLMDYGDFVVHVFHEDTRDYYDLERLWGDAPRLEVLESADNGQKD